MKVTTKYKSNHNGTGQIVAKCNGKQKTVTLDLSRSNDWNHGNAAGALILAKGAEIMANATPADIVARIDEGRVEHDSNDAGTEHTFVI